MKNVKRTRQRKPVGAKRRHPEGANEAGTYSGKKMRFSTGEANMKHDSGPSVDETATEEDDIEHGSFIHVARRSAPFRQERERYNFQKDLAEGFKDSENATELESEWQDQRRSETEKNKPIKPRKIVTLSWDPLQEPDDSDIIGARGSFDMSEFLKSKVKPEIVGQHLGEMHSLTEFFISQWFNFNELARHPNGRSASHASPLETLEQEASAELRRYITCYASGGPLGVEGWEQLFKDKDSREALIYSVIGKALEEHVFGELLFGGDEEQTGHLQQQEVSGAENDGFERIKNRADYIRKCLRSQNGEGVLSYPPEYWPRIRMVTLQLYALLYPLLLLNPKTAGLQLLKSRDESEAPGMEPQNKRYWREEIQNGLLLDLREVVRLAAMTSVLIRLCKDTSFHFQPVFKNTAFDPTFMQPWDPDFLWNEDAWNMDNDLNSSYRAAHWDCHPVVQVICCSAIVAFKKGGPEEVEQAKERGLRVKTLRRAIVSLRWGKPRAVPPKPDDGYLEFEEALQKYMNQDQEAIDEQIRNEIQEQQNRVGKGHWCVLM